MNDSDHDLHDELLSNLYQQSRIEEPPMALDSAILTEARKAVEKPEKKSIWNRMGWMMPLASVAVAMLTVSLFIQTKQEYPEVLDTEIMYDIAPMKESVLEKKDASEPLMERGQRAAPVRRAAKEAKEKKEVIVSRSIRSQSKSKYSAAVEVRIEVWLEKIRELIRQGETDKARESLKAFRKVHPDYSLPENITSALE